MSNIISISSFCFRIRISVSGLFTEMLFTNKLSAAYRPGAKWEKQLLTFFVRIDQQ